MLKFAFFLLLLLPVAVVAQTPSQEEVPGEYDIYLAKDDGKGKAGDRTENFYTTDIPIYCVVMMAENEPATVKMDFIVVNVAGVKPETRVVSTSFKTDGTHDRVNFTGMPHKKWMIGKYRADIYVNGELVGKRVFNITEQPNVRNASAVKPVNNFRMRKKN